MNNIKTEVLLLLEREDELKGKVNTYDEDRKHLLDRIAKLSIEDCESNQQLNIFIHNIKDTLNDCELLLTNPQLDDKNENVNINEVSTKSLKKCRYYNRGYCKFQEHCIFVHPVETCTEYLHVGSMKFVSSNMEGINGLVGSEPEEAPTMETEKHTELVYSCDKCDYTINNELLLTEHAATHHERAQHFPCDECHFVAKNKGGLTRHTNSKHKLSYSCNSCDYISQTEPDLMEHRKSIHNLNASTSNAVEEPNFFTFNLPINFPTTPHYRT